LTGSTGFSGYFFPGFPDENLETPMAFGNIYKYYKKFEKISLASQRFIMTICLSQKDIRFRRSRIEFSQFLQETEKEKEKILFNPVNPV
jgi:hypothetical protein